MKIRILCPLGWDFVCPNGQLNNSLDFLENMTVWLTKKYCNHSRNEHSVHRFKCIQIWYFNMSEIAWHLFLKTAHKIT